MANSNATKYIIDFIKESVYMCRKKKTLVRKLSLFYIIANSCNVWLNERQLMQSLTVGSFA